MAIAVDKATIGSIGSALAGTSATLTTSVTASANSFIVLLWGYFGGGPITSVSGGGLGWTIDKQGNPIQASASVAIISAQAPSGLASGTDIVATFQNLQSAFVVGGMSLFGVKTSSPVDGTPPNGTGANAQAWATGSYAMAAGSVLVGGSYNQDNASANTPTAPGLEAWEVNDGADAQAGVQMYRIESSAGSYTLAGSWGTSANTGSLAVAYLAAPATQQQVLMPHGLAAGAAG